MAKIHKVSVAIGGGEEVVYMGIAKTKPSAFKAATKGTISVSVATPIEIADFTRAGGVIDNWLPEDDDDAQGELEREEEREAA